MPCPPSLTPPLADPRRDPDRRVLDLLDGTIVNVAAPSIRVDLGASSTALQWMVGGYPLAIAVGMITGSRLGDLYGRRRLFVVGAAGFTAASILCGLAPSVGVLVGGRLLQGLFGALLLPQGLGLLRDAFPPEELPKAFAVFGPVIGAAAILGPIIGGGLVDLDLLGTGWRLVFLVNLPLGVIAVIGGLRLLPESRPSRGARLDLVGTALITAAAVLLVYPLIQGRELDWPAWTFVSMAASGVLLAVFVVHQRARERAGRDPLVVPSVFSHRGYASGVLIVTVFFAGMIGGMLALTLFMQIGEHFSAIHAGLSLVPLFIGLSVGAALSGAVLGPRFGRKILQLGALVTLAGWAVLILTLHGSATVSSWDFVPGLLIAGAGIGLVVAPLFDIILAPVTDREAGSASGVLNALQQLGASVGIAGLGTLFFSVAGNSGFSEALQRTLWVQIGLLALVVLLSPLLPARARPEAAAAGVEAAQDATLAAV